MGDLKNKQVMYNQVFGNEAGKKVIRDLNRFCCGTKTMFHGETSAIDLARREGRREVLLQILTTMKIDIEELFDEYVADDVTKEFEV